MRNVRSQINSVLLHACIVLSYKNERLRVEQLVTGKGQIKHRKNFETRMTPMGSAVTAGSHDYYHT